MIKRCMQLIAGVILVAAPWICKPHPLTELETAPPGTVEWKDDKGLNLEWCPDNTCVSFEAPIKTSRDAVQDFALLYLYGSSTYYVLDEWRRKPATERAIAAVAHRYGCAGSASSLMAQTKCAMDALHKRYKISAYDVTYDEHQRIQTPIQR